MKKIMSLLAVLLLVAGALAPSAHALSFSISVGDQPYYSHGPGYWYGGVYYVWVPGHWGVRHGNRVWVHGHYRVR
jgi:WXXGXW repeat (2 copies)